MWSIEQRHFQRLSTTLTPISRSPLFDAEYQKRYEILT